MEVEVNSEMDYCDLQSLSLIYLGKTTIHHTVRKHEQGSEITSREFQPAVQASYCEKISPSSSSLSHCYVWWIFSVFTWRHGGHVGVQNNSENSIIMQNLSDILPLFCAPTWPSHHVSEWNEGRRNRTFRERHTERVTSKIRLHHMLGKFVMSKSWDG